MSDVIELKLRARAKTEKFRCFLVHNEETKKTALEIVKELEADLKTLEEDFSRDAVYTSSANSFLKNFLEKSVSSYDSFVAEEEAKKKEHEKTIVHAKKEIFAKTEARKKEKMERMKAKAKT